jgi:hypothetical protein
MRIPSLTIAANILTLATNEGFLAVFIQGHALEHLDHLNNFTVAILLLLSLLPLTQQLVPQKIYHDLFLDVGPTTQKILLDRGRLLCGVGFLRGGMVLGTDGAREASVGGVQFDSLFLETAATITGQLGGLG